MTNVVFDLNDCCHYCLEGCKPWLNLQLESKAKILMELTSTTFGKPNPSTKKPHVSRGCGVVSTHRVSLTSISILSLACSTLFFRYFSLKKWLPVLLGPPPCHRVRQSSGMQPLLVRTVRSSSWPGFATLLLHRFLDSATMKHWTPFYDVRNLWCNNDVLRFLIMVLMACCILWSHLRMRCVVRSYNMVNWTLSNGLTI
jgi:hypothetical protein